MMREMLGKKQADLRNSLKTAVDDPVERLFIDRVVLTWFRLNYFERLCALAEPANVTWARMQAEQLQRAETSHSRALRDFLSYRDHRPDITIEIREAESPRRNSSPKVRQHRSCRPTEFTICCRFPSSAAKSVNYRI
jgi:hypothetical protein